MQISNYYQSVSTRDFNIMKSFNKIEFHWHRHRHLKGTTEVILKLRFLGVFLKIDKHALFTRNVSVYSLVLFHQILNSLFWP